MTTLKIIVIGVFSILTATAYGVIFSIEYPRTEISENPGLITLFGLLGIATTLIGYGLTRLVQRAPRRQRHPRRV
jgi:hypothetical protein